MVEKNNKTIKVGDMVLLERSTINSDDKHLFVIGELIDDNQYYTEIDTKNGPFRIYASERLFLKQWNNKK